MERSLASRRDDISFYVGMGGSWETHDIHVIPNEAQRNEESLGS